MRIRDWLGRVVKPQQIKDEQSARIAGLHSDYANHPSRGLTPARLAAILEDAEQGDLLDQCDLFEDMEEKDPHIFTELSKRKRALLGLDWSIEPPGDASAAEQQAAEAVTEWIGDMDNFEDLLFDMADAIGKGFACLELDWQARGKVLIPAPVYRPARWFQAKKDQILLRTDDGRGDELWPMGWISHIHKAKSGYIARAGLHRVLAWPFLFKNYSVRDLAEFLEIYGIPARIGTYPAGASEREKTTLLNAVMSVGHHAAGIMPEGMMLDFKEAAKGASDPFQAMIAWCESSQSKAILGGTLTTSAENTGLGSNLGDVHNEVRHDLLVSDARQIAGTLTRDLVWPLIALNIPGIERGRAPKFVFNTRETEDLVMLSDALPKLVTMGMRIPVEWAHDKLQIPQAGKDEPVLGGQPESAPAEKTAAATARREGHACCAGAQDEPDEVDAQVNNLLINAQPAVDTILDQIKHLLYESASLEDFENRLLAEYANLDTTDLTEVMALGLSAAELLGRFEAGSEDG